jgi:hypothetical protein
MKTLWRRVTVGIFGLGLLAGVSACSSGGVEVGATGYPDYGYYGDGGYWNGGYYDGYYDYHHDRDDWHHDYDRHHHDEYGHHERHHDRD